MAEPFTAGPFCIGSPIWSGLSKLVEETGEVQQLAGKLIATGGTEQHWDGSNLRERLVEELADLSAAIDYFGRANGLLTEEFYERYHRKIEQFRAWEREQKPK